MAPLPVAEVLASPRAIEARDALNPSQRRKLDWWIARLKTDAFAGDQIPKRLIPPMLAVRHGLPGPLSNAWRFELPGGWRGIYRVADEEKRPPTVVILEILSHKDYDRLFGYR